VTAVLAASIGILAWVFVAALRLVRRSGEARAGILAVLAALQGLAVGALLAVAWRRPLDFDAASGAALATLGASLATLLTLRAFAATLEELDLAEALHWGSMQGVRAVTQLAAEPRGELAERLAALLELGCDRFGLEVGFLSRIEGEQQEIRALRAPAGFPLAVGARLPLGSTLCRQTLAGRHPLAVEQISAAAWARPANGDPLGFEAYLGAAVTAGERPFGTLVFASQSGTARRFTASHKDLLALMAHWAGVEIERWEQPRAGAGTPVLREPTPIGVPPRRVRARRAGVDLNEVLHRVERRIRDLAPPRVRLVVRGSESPVIARHPGLPPESLLLTLVGHAIDAMQGAGTLTLSSEHLAADASRWVALRVSHTGRGPDAGDLARAFAAGRGSSRDALALAHLVRALRRGGGDLSVEVDPKRGATFTVFLPAIARDSHAQALPRAAAAAPHAPSPPPGS